MLTFKKNDFVTLHYTGKITDTGQIFDTTSKETAEKEGIYNSKMSYNAVTICVGQNQILPGIDESIISKNEGDQFNVNVESDKAFGKKSSKLIKLIPSNIFKKQNIRPFVGLEVQIDNTPGIVRTLSGGRIMVDFNHPLAGKDLEYEIKLEKEVTDPETKLVSYLMLTFGIKDPKVTFKDGKAEVGLGSLPEQITKPLIEKITTLIPEIKTIEFVAGIDRKTK